MTGDRVKISPQEPVGQDFFGNLWNLSGEGSRMQSMGGVAGPRRALGSLLRSIPQYRIAEIGLAGGRPVYPESLPLPGYQRPIPVRDASRKDIGTMFSPNLGGLLSEYTGVDPKEFNLRRTKRTSERGLKYARSRRKTANKRTMRKLKRDAERDSR
jgi:hypothetical protein